MFVKVIWKTVTYFRFKGIYHLEISLALYLGQRQYVVCYYYHSVTLRAGLLNVTVPMELSLYLLKEREYVPWATALEHFQAWSRYLSEAAPYRLFLRYMKHLLGPVAHSLGWEDTGTHMNK